MTRGEGSRAPEPRERDAAAELAGYVAALRYEDLPPRVAALAALCLADAVGCAAFGQRFPWSRMVLDLAASNGRGGRCALPGVPGVTLHPAPAALVLGAFAHAFELDSLRKPGAGVHPGATVALPALAMAQAVGASGRDLLTAIVAGIETQFRIGAATLHSAERNGFHAPGITGPFGAAAACGLLMKLPAEALANAFGLCGSLGGGLLAFAKSGTGGMVKRLHLGRAAEAGVVAATLARAGYEGPSGILEGPFGVLDVFCQERDPARLTAGLGSVFEIERLCIKRYACHVSAQPAVELLREWVTERRLAGDAIAGIAVDAPAKVASHHDIPAPADLMLAQYSLPFNLALAAYRDPIDPVVYSDEVLADAKVGDLARRVAVTSSGAVAGWGADLTVTLRSGEVLHGRRDLFTGCPERPFTAATLRAKFERLAAGAVPSGLYDRLVGIAALDDTSRLALA